MGVDSFEFEVTDRLRRVIELVRGKESATTWLRDLPSLVKMYAARWELTLTGLPDSGAMSCCVFARGAGGQDVVLKIPFDRMSGLTESALLDRWSHRGGAPTVHRVDRATGVFLMSRVVPGTIGEPQPSAAAAHRIVELMQRLHDPHFDGLPELPDISEIVLMRADWADERFLATRNAAGVQLARAARALAMELLAASAPETLLHGDLQPKNILRSAGQGLQVIDPLACVGPRVTDAALWSTVQAGVVPIEVRIEQLCRFGDFDPGLLRSWVTVFAVLELRPYAMTYSARMAAYLKSNEVSPRLKSESGEAIASLVDGALSVTVGI